MSTHVVVGAFAAHVTITKGDLATQFYVDRHGMLPPVSVRSNGTGYSIRAKDPDVDLLPAELREDVAKAIRKYQAKFLLVGNS